jgi:quercetin dioxygenase-like cupin family protein
MTPLKNPIHNFTYVGTIVHVYNANKGEGLPKHEHEYPHAMFCTAGACIVRKEDKEVVLTKISRPVNLPAKQWHEIEALEDGTVFISMFDVKQQ